MWKYTVEVNGMMCGMYEAHINDAVRKACPVKKVHSSVPNARRWSSLKQSWTRKPSQPPSAARDTKLAPSKRNPIKREGSSVYNLKAASFNPQVVYGNPAILSMS